jgi:zinc transport system permease protein
MDSVYQAIAGAAKRGALPSMFQHVFMIRGLFAALLVGPLLGGIGTVVVPKRLAFFTQTIGHASLTGVALGLLLGEPLGQTYVGLYGFCLLVALLLNFIKNRTDVSSDTVTGVVLAQILGLGIIMLVLVTKEFNIHQVEAVLFGSLITINDADLALLGVTALGTAVAGSALYNRWMLVSLSPALAKARGLRPVLLDYAFIVLLTLVVVSSLKLVGALLVLVLIVVPAAGAQNVARNLRQFFWLSIALATVSTVSGLAISGLWPIPTGSAIVLASSALFYATLLLRSALGP